MKVQIISGVMIRGTAVFPKTKTGEGKNEKEVDSIVEVDKSDARTLIASKQAKPAPKDAKVTVVIKDPESVQDALDAFFGDEDEDE